MKKILIVGLLLFTDTLLKAQALLTEAPPVASPARLAADSLRGVTAPAPSASVAPFQDGGSMQGMGSLPTTTIRTLTDRLNSDEEILLVRDILREMQAQNRLDTLMMTNALIVIEDLAKYHFLKDDSLARVKSEQLQQQAIVQADSLQQARQVQATASEGWGTGTLLLMLLLGAGGYALALYFWPLLKKIIQPAPKAPFANAPFFVETPPASGSPVNVTPTADSDPAHRV